nr:hypothetical protein [Candidatus Freyarchaeota archaeon]
MGRYVTVSVKIPQELREKMKQLDIKASEVLRSAIEEEVRRREVEKLKEDIDKLKPVPDKVSMEEVVKNIRKYRDNR